MIVLGSIIAIVLGAICIMAILSYESYKKSEIDYKIAQDKQLAEATDASLKLQIEKEKTKQLEIKSKYREKHGSTMNDESSQLEIEREKTKQLEIKERYRKEHDSNLY